MPQEQVMGALYAPGWSTPAGNQNNSCRNTTHNLGTSVFDGELGMDWMENISDLSNMTTVDHDESRLNYVHEMDAVRNFPHELDTPNPKSEEFDGFEFQTDQHDDLFFNSDNLLKETMRDLEVTQETRDESHSADAHLGTVAVTDSQSNFIVHDETTMMEHPVLIPADHVTPHSVNQPAGNEVTVAVPTMPTEVAAATPTPTTEEPTADFTSFRPATSNTPVGIALRKLFLNTDIGEFLKEDVGTPEVVKLMQENHAFSLLDLDKDDMEAPSAEAPTVFSQDPTAQNSYDAVFHSDLISSNVHYDVTTPPFTSPAPSDPLAIAVSSTIETPTFTNAIKAEPITDVVSDQGSIVDAKSVGRGASASSADFLPAQCNIRVIKAKPDRAPLATPIGTASLVPTVRLVVKPTNKFQIYHPSCTATSDSVLIPKVEPTVSRSILNPVHRQKSTPIKRPSPLTFATAAKVTKLATAVPSTSQDDKHRIQREKNNVASKRSRATRKQRMMEAENSITDIEEENMRLRGRVTTLRRLVAETKDALADYMKNVSK